MMTLLCGKYIIIYKQKAFNSKILMTTLNYNLVKTEHGLL